MAEPWFHRRTAEQGTGYGLRSWQGAVAASAAVLAIVASIVVPILLGAGAWTVYLIAAVVGLIAVFALVRLAAARSD